MLTRHVCVCADDIIPHASRPGYTADRRPGADQVWVEPLPAGGAAARRHAPRQWRGDGGGRGGA